MRISIADLDVSHAAAAAAMHTEGQPGTFLTSLGPAFLRTLYAEMAMSPLCYGSVALDADNQVVGVVVGTMDAGQVFKQMIWRRGWRLAPSVAWAIVRNPRLIKQVWETLSYPDQAQTSPDEAELFYIGVRADARRQGVGQALFEALALASRKRNMRALGLTVDATNMAAQTFYQARGMSPVRAMSLYGRSMYWYDMPLSVQGEK